MGIHLADQTLAFLYACLLGACLGMLYDVFRILRIAIPSGKGVIFIQDVMFFVLCAAATFLFLLTAVDGIVRVFLFIGEILGGVLYHCTVGQLVMKVAQVIIDGFKAVIRFLIRYIFSPIWRLAYAIVTILLYPVRLFGCFLKKSLQRLRFRLKVRRMVLYNQLVDPALKKRVGANRKISRREKRNGRKAKSIPKKES